MQDDERIRHRAHELWEAAGKPDGEHDAHWEQARREIEAEPGPSSPQTDTADTAPTKSKKSPL